MRNYKLVISREHKDKQHTIWWYKTLADLFIVSYKRFKVNCGIWQLAMCRFACYDWNYGKRRAVIYKKGQMTKTQLNEGKLRGVRGVVLIFSCSCIITVKSVLPTSLPLLPLSLTSFCFSIRHGVFSPFLRCRSLSLRLSLFLSCLSPLLPVLLLTSLSFIESETGSIMEFVTSAKHRVQASFVSCPSWIAQVLGRVCICLWLSPVSGGMEFPLPLQRSGDWIRETSRCSANAYFWNSIKKEWT